MIHGIAAAEPHTDALMTALEAAGVLAGRAVFPAGGGWQGEPSDSAYVGYCVVYPTMGDPDGNPAEPYEYLDYTAQISCWGATEGQATGEADRVRAALIGRRLDVPGRSTYPVRQIPGSSPPVRRVSSPPPDEFCAVVEIAVRSQPQQ